MAVVKDQMVAAIKDANAHGQIAARGEDVLAAFAKQTHAIRITSKIGFHVNAVQEGAKPKGTIQITHCVGQEILLGDAG